MGSSGGSSLSFSQSPQAQQILSQFMPVLQRAATAGTSGNAWETMGAPMPTTSWFNSIAPEVKQGVWKPYEETGQNMMASLFGSGFGGSARGGLSGTTSNLLSDYYAKAGTNYGQQLWNMTYPSMQSAWQMPYQLAASSMGSTLPNTVVTPNPQSTWSTVAPSLGLGAAYGLASNAGSIYNSIFGPSTTGAPSVK